MTHFTLNGDRRRRAYSIIELMVVLLLLSTFTLIYSQAISTSAKAGQDARTHDALIHRLDNALDVLRRDVWSASAIRAGDIRLELEIPAGRVIWVYRDGTLTREASNAAPRVWKDLPPVRFGGNGPLVTLTVTGPGRAGDELVTLSSQRMLAGGTP